MITKPALHVITRAVCNEMGPLHAVITDPGCNEALQDGRVITCNGSDVTAPLGMTVPDDSDESGLCERVKGVPTGTPVLTPGTTSMIREVGQGPPTCCQPERLSWDEAGKRLAAAHARAVDSQPTVCPACGGADLAPMFDPSGDFWSCGCGNVWEERP